MAESTLSTLRSEILQEIGRLQRWDKNPALWSDEQKAEAEQTIRRGLRKFYNPPPLRGERSAHVWSFIRPLGTMLTVAPYNAGTIEIISGIVTLTGGTWPAWAGPAQVLDEVLAPAAVVNDNAIGIGPWQGPSNVETDNASSAAIEFTNNTTNYLAASFPAMSIPAGNEVVGARVRVRRAANIDDRLFDSHVQLRIGGTIDGDNKADVDNAWSDQEDTIEYGQAGDLWNHPGLTREAAIEGDIEVLFAVEERGVEPTEAQVFYIDLTIYHADPNASVVDAATVIVAGQRHRVAGRISDSRILLADLGVNADAGTEYVLEHSGDYDLPDDFGGVDGLITFDAEYRKAPIHMTGDAQIRSLRQGAGHRRAPERAAVRSLRGSGTTGQRHVLMLYPIPDQEYRLTFRYWSAPDTLTDDAPFPWGGAPHSETVLQACLAVAESYNVTRKSDFHHNQFLQQLAASVSHDRSLMSPDSVGISHDGRTQGRGDPRASMVRYTPRSS